MSRYTSSVILRRTLLFTLAAASAGCLDYTIETTVYPDGTGERVQRMDVTRNDDFHLPGPVFRALTLATPERGWTHSTEIDPDGDTTWTFHRRTNVRSLADWSSPDRSVLILGTTPERSEARVGYVRLGDVVFRSNIQVATTRGSDGKSTVTYRESLMWDNAADAIVEFILRDLDQILKTRYPRLADGERGQIVGFARARIWVAGEEGLFHGENEDEAIARAVESTAEHGVKIIRARYPAAGPDVLREVMEDLLDLENEASGRLFQETLPGLNLGFNTSVVFRLRLPGRVTTTNAESRDGEVLEWTFSPLDDLAAPIEVFAESVIGS